MENIIYMSNEGVSTISINRPKAYNALDVQTLNVLLETIKIIKENDDKMVILTGEGPAFSAGGYINMMREITSVEVFGEMMDVITELTLELYLLPQLVITAINGSAYDLGLSLVINSEYNIAEYKVEYG